MLAATRWRIDTYFSGVDHRERGIVLDSGATTSQRIALTLRCKGMNVMTTPAEIRLARRVLRHELEVIRANWGWFLALGIILIIVGTGAVAMPIVAGLATAVTFGALLLLGGTAQLVGAFWTRDWSGFFLSLLMGVLYLVLGLLFLSAPLKAEEAMTLFLACVLLVGGLFRIFGSLMYQFPHWGWTLVGGAINLTLGILIWRQLPEAALWVIGLFVGIDMIFTGWTWVMLALAVKNAKIGVSPSPVALNPSNTESQPA
jgi:uncharacterized membrane protein HdeD (DUF308 family)